MVEEDGEVACVLQDHTSHPIVTTLLDVNDDDSCLWRAVEYKWPFVCALRSNAANRFYCKPLFPFGEPISWSERLRRVLTRLAIYNPHTRAPLCASPSWSLYLSKCNRQCHRQEVIFSPAEDYEDEVRANAPRAVAIAYQVQDGEGLHVISGRFCDYQMLRVCLGWVGVFIGHIHVEYCCPSFKSSIIQIQCLTKNQCRRNVFRWWSSSTMILVFLIAICGTLFLIWKHQKKRIKMRKINQSCFNWQTLSGDFLRNLYWTIPPRIII